MHAGTRVGSSPCPSARLPAIVSTATTPCCEAAWARRSGPTRSPIAYTSAALVRMFGSTTTKPFSVRTPASSSRPPAEDEYRRGEQRPLERLAAGEHDLAVDLEPGQGTLAAPAGEEHEARAAPLAATRHAAADEPAHAVVIRDPVLLEQELD